MKRRRLGKLIFLLLLLCVLLFSAALAALVIMEKTVPAKFLEMNRRAFELGYSA